MFEGNRWIIPANDLELCLRTLNELEQRLIEAWQDNNAVYDLMPGISDLFWNAIIHGSYEVNKEDKLNENEKWLDVIRRLQLTTAKKVTITLDIKPDFMEITFQDEGPGYDPSEYKEDALLAPTGKGKKVIQEYRKFDEVVYDKPNKSVTVRKKK